MSDRLEALVDAYHHAVWDLWKGRIPHSDVGTARAALIAYVEALERELELAKKERDTYKYVAERAGFFE